MKRQRMFEFPTQHSPQAIPEIKVPTRQCESGPGDLVIICVPMGHGQIVCRWGTWQIMCLRDTAEIVCWWGTPRECAGGARADNVPKGHADDANQGIGQPDCLAIQLEHLVVRVGSLLNQAITRGECYRALFATRESAELVSRVASSIWSKYMDNRAIFSAPPQAVA